MVKKVLLLILTLSIMVVSANVYAATVATDGMSNFSEMQSNYNKGLQKVTVSAPNTNVDIYGYSKCNGSSCTVSYNKNNPSMSAEDALKDTVVCSNGSSDYTIISVQNGGAGYQSDNKEKHNGEAYFSVTYTVTCSSSNGSTNNGGINAGDSSTGTDSSNDSISDNSSNSGTSSGSNSSSSSDYQSSTSTEQSETGVETYYIVLGIVALITYVGMVIVKKYNLFKNI